jgi:hypothetical protein
MFKKDLGLNYDKWVSSALKSISFIGLNKAIKEHCGLELDRIKESEDFAMKILKFIKKHISERNQMENSNYCFTQAHEGEYFRFSNSQFGENPHKIIRGSSTLNLSKKILLFQRVNPLLDGGCSFELKLDSMDPQEITPKIKIVLNSNLPVFQIK